MLYRLKTFFFSYITPFLAHFKKVPSTIKKFAGAEVRRRGGEFPRGTYEVQTDGRRTISYRVQ